MGNILVGREKEINKFKEMISSKSSELIAVYGRRRIGKTFLIREFFKQNIVFELTGYYQGNTRDQLRNFRKELIRSSAQFEDINIPNDWFIAFQLLEEYLNSLKSNKKKVVFIDEFPWLASARSKFLMTFEHFWNTYCTKHNDLVVVICGSAASFMVNKIIKNKGGLHNRLSCKIRLMPFTLNETERFLKSKKIELTRYDIIQLYMATGGVPFYLNKIKRGESVPQNIDRLFFREDSDLANEFNEIFTSLFAGAKTHEKIVRILSKSIQGITRGELLKRCKLDSSGGYTKSLTELIESGFVSQYQPFGKKSKDSLFRLSDEYSLFFLKFIEPNRGQGDGTWVNLFIKQSYKVWSGFVFETICLKHIEQIKEELGIAKIYSVHSSWFNKNAQIDLLIDRDDRIINICEMKFYESTFTINKSTYLNLKNKLKEFKSTTNTRKNVFITFISTFGVSANPYSIELLHNNFTIDCLFNK